jgi:hypothetical protein
MSIIVGLEIIIRETAGFERQAEPVRIGLPVPKGRLAVDSRLAVRSTEGVLSPCQSRVLKQWPDGSVKWLLLDFMASFPAQTTQNWSLVLLDDEPEFKSSIVVTQSPEEWRVDTGAGVFCLDANILRPFTHVMVADGTSWGGEENYCQIDLHDIAGAIPQIDSIQVEDNGALHTVLRIEGIFRTSESPELRFRCRLHFFAGSMQVKVSITLHNPNAAKHPRGHWDLGDPGSIFLKRFVFSFALPSLEENVCHCFAETKSKPFSSSARNELLIYQEASGGENWQSPNHRNRFGKMPLTQTGYHVLCAGELVGSGLRATPIMWAGHDGRSVSASLPLFWQEFPKQISVLQRSLQVELFPERFPDLHELQGGEQKTHEFFVSFSGGQKSLNWTQHPLLTMASAETFRAAKVFGDLPSGDQLVDQFATAKDFFAKRESIDEYGWRNFGDIYADHEAVLNQDKDLFISHYNNQYDFLAGAYRKAFSSEDFAWLEIASDLASHVRDVDIYHTDMDRDEYNGGLFWHTDHYAKAGLSTHRSYSKEQSGAYEMHVGGGGPGAEHCYTSGLTIHYFLTGDNDSRDAVIELASWQMIALSGTQTVLGTLKKALDNLKQWRISRGNKVLFPVYPLTRGTGNTVAAFLDAFEVSGDIKWLKETEKIIAGTIHPLDDIRSRNLLTPEFSWSYSVLLMSLVKYLDKKCELNEIDSSYEHARLSFIHYVDWMVENEYVYLEKPELLEYPNETWAAQELRKSVIFFCATRYTKDERQQARYVTKSRYFFNSAADGLSRNKNSGLTRPVALMLQNDWVAAYLDRPVQLPSRIAYEEVVQVEPIPLLTLASVFKRFCRDMTKAFMNTSLKKEWGWIRTRMC